MKVEELRIGNWVIGTHGWQSTVHYIGMFDGVYSIGLLEGGYSSFSVSHSLDEIYPIPLTEEKLDAVGFSWSIRWQANANDDFYGKLIECYPKENGYNLVLKKDNILLRANIKYLHEWQNIYHELTGKELKIK